MKSIVLLDMPEYIYYTKTEFPSYRKLETHVRAMYPDVPLKIVYHETGYIVILL